MSPSARTAGAWTRARLSTRRPGADSRARGRRCAASRSPSTDASRTMRSTGTPRSRRETWTLRRPVQVSLADPTMVSGLELAADGQRLAADLHLGGARPTAHVVVTHLDLARLPRALVPERAGLGGTVDADVRAAIGDSP